MNDYRNQYDGTVAGRAGVAVDEGLRSYMLGVYNYMAMGIAGAGLVSYLVASNESLVFAIAGSPLKWGIMIAILALGWFSGKIIFSGSKLMAHALYWAYAALWGLWAAPMIYAFVGSGNAVEVYKAFFITASMFGAVSIFGYTTKKDLSGWGSFLFMAIIGLIIAGLVNVFLVQSSLFSVIFSCASVLIFAALTAYETQMVKSIYREGATESNERGAIFGAFALFGSFVVMFLNILNILGFMND